MDFAKFKEFIDVEVNSILNSDAKIVLNLVKEKSIEIETLPVKWTHVIKLLREKNVRYIIFEPCDKVTLQITSIGSLTKSLGNAFLELEDKKCSIVIFNIDFPIKNDDQTSTDIKELCYFEWLPGAAPFREEIQHGVYTGSFFQHWRSRIFREADVPRPKVLLRRFPGNIDLKLPRDEFLRKKAQIICQFTWHEMRDIYQVCYELSSHHILPDDVFRIILNIAFLVS